MNKYDMASQRWHYDSIDGVCNALSSLETLNDLIDERRTAGYNRHERLNEFYIFGRYMLDCCGNLRVAHDFIPAEKIPDFPKIADHNIFWDRIKTWQKKEQPNVLTDEEIRAPDFKYSENKRPYPISVSFSIKDPIPPTNIICSYCGKGWVIDNCHDVIRKKEQIGDKVDAKDYIGKTHQYIRTELLERIDALYILHNFIQNDKYIDLTPKKGYDTLKENEHGHLDVKKDYVIQEGDYIYYEKVFYYHRECTIAKCAEECEEHRKNNGKDYKQFNLAGLIESDSFVKLELDLAGIPAVKGERYGEPGSHYKGRLGKFNFERAWYYWIVSGLVPLDLAKKMYEDKEGGKSVRVAGHCGCPPPEEWAKRIDNGKELCNKSELEAIKSEEIKKVLINNPKLKWVDDKSKSGQLFVTTYHIDSWQGLKLFADTVRDL